ncbi:replicative DNA helicase [Candidatus Kuenenbacteria bacterium CG23_combo_of_CG06-09_8_20_14_all_36_9]|uniref:Replicative DNA helicase n=1 Tax=Candidatus Kuenenbacteria bacterium CG10_big_fil_rev_8_21_14_0_10_36_11 TaxID=1974618 RepID=A0A2M6WA58_9BACT|nr:MAG: replicative DNA helicase [Candidatus Kuenenbacteria bacterium CG23_combo_of_CG06-09_8_20_14_all_36_9]PIT89689.1 MAG: replicative DNA helicase [Candidatus Kuenenbacteria bacterium CG10_big_fil_rev_8_21_14_0_10_36_11]
MPNPNIDRLPPQNIEAEQSVLGSLMIDKDAIIKIADFLIPEDFYKNAHAKIYEAMLELYNNREPIDILSLASRLEETGQLEKIGGRTYLTTLANSVPTASHIVYYAKIIQKKSTLNRLIRAATEIVQLGYNEGEEIQKVLDTAESKLYNVSQQFLKNQFSSIKDLLSEAFDRIDELHRDAGKLRGLPTGFYELDQKLAGLQKSNLLILAARPSMGKTSLALDMARKIAVEQKIPVGIFSLEMSKEELVDRMLCAEADVDMWKMRTGKLSDREDFSGESDFSKIGHAMGKLAEAKIFIDDSPTANVMEIRTKARRLQAEHGIGFIVLDYLQLMDSASASYSDNRVQVVSEISRGLKAVARELDIPLLAISQLSRQVENRPTAIPKLADLRESGSIEQDADVVLFIYREEMYKRDTVRPHIADIYIAKHRNGPTGVMELFFDETKASFKNLEKKIEGQMPSESS